MSLESNSIDTTSTVPHSELIESKPHLLSTQDVDRCPPNQSFREPTKSDRKYNLIIFGIDKHPKGTPRYRRLTQDLEAVLSVLSRLDSSVTCQSVLDSFSHECIVNNA